MGELISLLSSIKGLPEIVTIFFVSITLITLIFLRYKDTDIQAATSVSKAQNEKLMALMNQNNSLLSSVSTLQDQITQLHHQMNADAEEHRKKMEQTYKIVDEMRIRITELEDLVRIYQKRQDHICIIEECPHRKK